MNIRQLRMEAVKRKSTKMKFEYSSMRDTGDMPRRKGEFIDAYTGQFKLDPNEVLVKRPQGVESFHDSFGKFFKFFLI